MPSPSNSNLSPDNDCESFFVNMEQGLIDFFDMDDQSILTSEFSHAFPIQTELQAIDERYSELELVGEGGMKYIYTARDKASNRIVAMATLRNEAGADKIEQFLREAQLTASLQHPNIIPVHDIGFDPNGQPYFTMERLKGETLADIISAVNNRNTDYCQRYTITKRLSLFLRICDAVAYAHSRNVLHLDIKPENIHVGDFGEVIVYDWGLAKILTDDGEPELGEELDANILNAVTIQGKLKGTPAFMAPEQASGVDRKTPQTDIYSLGALLYTLLSGKTHVNGASIDELLENTCNHVITPLSKAAPSRQISKSLEAVVMKALELDPDDRYQSVEQLSSDLMNYLTGYATKAEKAGIMTRTMLMAMRHMRIFAMLVACLLIIIMIAGTALFYIQNEREVALHQKSVAEKNLAMYKESQLEKSELEMGITAFYNNIIKSEDMNEAHSKIALLDKRIPDEPDPQKKKLLIHKKGILHFVIQEFNNAFYSLKQVLNKGDRRQILRAAELGRTLKLDNELLSDKELVEVIDILGAEEKQLTEALFDHHMLNRPQETPQDEYLYLARIMLNVCNNIWDNNSYNGAIVIKNGVLDLSGTRYRTLRTADGYGMNILEPLKFDTLDLSHSAFFEFMQLKGLQFPTLNIAGCKTNHLDKGRYDMFKSFGIETFIVSDKLSQEEMRFLSNHFETIVISSK